MHKLINFKSLTSTIFYFCTFQIPEHGLARLNERLLLFRHDYSSPNILQMINSASEITDETLVEIVLTGKLANSLFLVSNKMKRKKMGKQEQRENTVTQ